MTKPIEPIKATKPIKSEQSQIKEKQLALNQLISITQAITSRFDLASRLGKSYSGKRDVYTAIGYSKTLEFDDYNARYIRQDISTTIVEAPVLGSWRIDPIITENQPEETELVKAWGNLARKKQIIPKLISADIVCGIGYYSVILLGLNDGGDLSQEVTSASELLYLMPYNEKNAQIIKLVTDTKNERYGMPELYSLRMDNVNLSGTTSGGTFTQTVHWSRVIHVTDGAHCSPIIGTPRLENVFNRLEDLLRVLSSAGEAYWQIAFPGYNFKLEQDSEFEGSRSQTLAELQTEIDKFVNQFQRYMKLEGVSVEALNAHLTSPKDFVDVLLTIISAARRIPKRILIGTEEGKLAGEQDSKHWDDDMNVRRHRHNEPILLRPLIDRLLDFGVLPPVQDPEVGYSIDWPPFEVPGGLVMAEKAERNAKALAAYASSIGAEQIYPPEIFLKREMGLNDEEIAMIQDIVKEQYVEDSVGEEEVVEEKEVDIEDVS